MTTIVFDGTFLAADGKSTGNLPRRKHYELRDNTPDTHYVDGSSVGHKKILRDVAKLRVQMTGKPTIGKDSDLEIIAVAGAGNANAISAVMNFVVKIEGDILMPLHHAMQFGGMLTHGVASCVDATYLFLTRHSKTKELKAAVFEWNGHKLNDITQSKTVGNIVAMGSGAKAAGLYHLFNPEATAMDCVAAACLVDPSSGISLNYWPDKAMNGELLWESHKVHHTHVLPTLKQLKKPLYKGYVKRTRAIVVPKITLPTFDKE